MSADNKNKMSSVESALSQIQRQYGKGSIMRLGSRETENIPAVPTGSLSER
jgi:recombination protein RecA